LIQALRKTGQNKDLPELLKRLAQLREQASKEEKERYRYSYLKRKLRQSSRQNPEFGIL